ncbi:MAG: tetratricopeptide repeat protein [Gemmatimonadaceae bacterium]|nr:tetratricopeptide repeat protein [Gemmatimonadaceae bacterium]
MAVGPSPAGHATGRDVALLRAMMERIDPRDPGGFNNLGVLYFSKGLYADAVDAFLRALTLDARMRTAARNLEVAASKPGACDARLNAIDVRLADFPRDVSARRERARLLRLIGRHDEAIAQLDTLLADDPDDAVALFERGLVEQRAGDLRRAQRWFERAVNVEFGHPVARLHLAEVLYQRGQNEQALAVLDAVIAQDDSMADAHLLRGFVLGDMGRHEAAVAATQHAASLNPSLQSLQSNLSLEQAEPVAAMGLDTVPERGMARYGLGLAFRQRGYFEEARREFERSRAQGEDAMLAQHAIAELDLIAGQFAAARESYDALLRAQPDHPRYWNEYGVALHQGGDVEGAADAYRSALRFDPRYALAYNNLGVALDDLGDADGARDALVRASEIDPTLSRAARNLGLWHLQRENPLAAMKVLRDLVAFHEDDADAWYALGLACHRLGWNDEAEGAFTRAVRERPTHAEARYGLADALRARGDGDGALRETQHALTLSSVRSAPRLSVGIAVQRECPEACGALALLTVRSDAPLSGVAVHSDDVAHLLPDCGATPITLEPVDVACTACDEADAFASRGVHGEALERYVRARLALDAAHATPEGEGYALWRRAAIGEVLSLCVLGRGEEGLSLIKHVGAHGARDPEVLALYACAAAAASTRAVDDTARAGFAADSRVAMLRVLRLEPRSAALMHFVGDAAVALRDAGLALACYRRALALDPTRPSPRVAIARLLRERGDLLAARLELVAALATAPGWREAVLELCEVHKAADRPAEALTVLTRHLANVPADLDALVMLAETLLRLSRADDARVAVLRVLRHDPAHLHALWLEGLLLVRQARVRDAMDRWRVVAANDQDARMADVARSAIADLDAGAHAFAGVGAGVADDRSTPAAARIA